ncbi:MAG TPA: SpoIIE family protein phosphatase [Candidatus Sulfomarinibacteraceae bacterium]|nr:SpoIIE family protein phosphatase [Candidatus Sulfomarinibacteraceae bacterium]
MLELKDFYLLPQCDALLRRLCGAGPGLVLVSGLEAQTASAGFLPSGRATIFRILMREMMERSQRGEVLVVARRKDAVRLPRTLRRRVAFELAQSAEEYVERIEFAVQSRPRLLVVDELADPPTMIAALDAARRGLWVLSQMDTVFRGATLVYDLLQGDLEPDHLEGLSWLVSVQRLPTLCPHCKQAVFPGEEPLRLVRQRYPHLQLESGATFYDAHGCERCEYSGRLGDVTAFDLFDAAGQPVQTLRTRTSELPLEQYVGWLAEAGQLPLDDLLQLETDQLRRTYYLLTGSQEALAQSNRALRQKVAELDSAYRVLQHHTQALVSMQEMNQALITTTDLHDLAFRVCRHTSELCGADRAVLYFRRDDRIARVLASHGWDRDRLPDEVPAADLQLPEPGGSHDPQPFDGWPPGIPPRHADVEGVYLYAGLRVPLVTQDGPVGLLVVHATQQKRFEPGDVALLRSFANQAALALQRAGLIQQLQAKIAALQAAQAELAQKERMERELELARQVQQSALPRAVPRVPGYRFAMRNEPARQVGGDFYDLVALDEDTFALTIADVSDKGMGAALYMALSRSLLLCEARLSRKPYDVLRSVNQLLLELGEPNMFVTIFYALVDRATGRMTYIRAGHDRPLLFRGDDVQELDGRGMALGLLPAHEFEMAEEEVRLQPGDRLVLYTDGLTDAVAPDGAMYDRYQFVDFLRANAHLPPDPLCDAAFTALDAYRGGAPREDDMTMLVIDVFPSGPEAAAE